MKELAIIGYGRFGRLAAKHLRPHFRVSVADDRTIGRLDRNLRRIRIDEAACKPIIILAVPINQLRAVLRRIRPNIRPGTLVIDVSSVKEMPVRWMRSALPRSVHVLGTHPLFGPESAAEGIKGHTIILCPVRVPRARRSHIVDFLTTNGLVVRSMTPEQHDRLMATTLFLTQFVGRGLDQLPLPAASSSTRNFHMLHHITTSARSDTMELFRDMFAYNRFAKRIPAKLIDALEEVHTALVSART